MRLIYYMSFVVFLLSLSCQTSKHPLIVNGISYKQLTPPGTTFISNNFYADQTEITNTFYEEYLYWVNRTFGRNSKNNKRALPDTLVWFSHDLYIVESSEPYSERYFRHPKYDNFPVVGVSYQQALDYCEWRSDRVYEVILIHKGLISPHPEQDSSNYFTRQKYLNEEYFSYKPDKSILVPQYALPTPEEWEIMASAGLSTQSYPFGIDSQTVTYIGRWQKRNLHWFNTFETPKKDTTEYRGNIYINDHYTSGTGWYIQNLYSLYDVIGNVSEMTATEGISKGGSWCHKLDSCKIEMELAYTIPTKWLGFRCVCHWVTAEEIIE